MPITRPFRINLPHSFLDTYQAGSSRAIEAFFDAAPDVFEIDTALCDMFGPNATDAPNGYLRRR